MTTSNEFLQSSVTGQTHKEIREKFGSSFNDMVKSEDLMANFALAFAWFRDHEHLPLPEAYEKAMSLSTDGVKALFEDPSVPDVKAVADFDSPPPTTKP